MNTANKTRNSLHRVWSFGIVMVISVLALGSGVPVWGAKNKDDGPPPPAAPKPSLGGKETPGLYKQMLEGPLGEVEEIVFATRSPSREWHFFANTGYACQNPDKKFFSANSGGLYALNLKTLEERLIFSDPGGAVRYPCVSYDGERILFSYRPTDSEVYHIYEINADGTGLRQITDGPFDDVEPIYVPDGGIVFTSARCHRYVPCLNSQVQILYRCELDGSGLRPLSAGQENELTPWMLSDGRVIYMRWEYVERDIRTYHHLWTIRPDGTNEMVFFGNNAQSYVCVRGGIVLTDAKPIPGTQNVVAISGSKHGSKEYRGHVVIIDPTEGPDDWDNIIYLTEGEKEKWRDPYPISENCFLVVADNEFYVMDAMGNWEKFHTSSSTMVHEPRPLQARTPEPVIPSEVDLSKTTGKMVLSQAHVGRNLETLKQGDVKKLMILEVLPKPVSWGNPGRMHGAGHNLKRLIGTVPVEPDGSAHFEAPAMRALMFVMLDENDKAIRRMRSFVTLMPGETYSCIGCHEERTYIDAPPQPALQALQREASRPELPAATPRFGIVDYPRDVQPILDKHCVKCHNDKFPKDAFSLSGGVTPKNSIGYDALARRVPLGKERGDDLPYTSGSGATKLLDMLRDGHGKVKLSEEELTILRLWMDLGTRWAGTYASLAPPEEHGFAFSDENKKSRRRVNAVLDASIIQNRCDGCHADDVKKRKDDVYRKYLQSMWTESFNLDRPEDSLILMAPLAKDAGGLGWCREEGTEKGAGAVFEDKTDEDYQAILSMVEQVRKGCYPRGAHFQPGFRGHPVYIREMKRYGVLPTDFDPETPIDPFAVDQTYYELFYPEVTPLIAAEKK